MDNRWIIAGILLFVGLYLTTVDHEENNKYLEQIGQPLISDKSHVGGIVICTLVVAIPFALIYFHVVK